MVAKRGYGDGGIDERGPGRWRLRWHVDGERHTQTVRGSAAEARSALRALQAGAREVRQLPKLTLSAWLPTWLALIEQKVGAKTRERYGELLRLHAARRSAESG